MAATMQLNPIGTIESCFRDKFGTPRQPGLVPEATAQLRLRPDLQPEICLQGLEGFSHVWLIFWFHLNKISQYHAKVHPPRLEGKSVGLFATRTPHRPNPLGLSLVRLVRIENSILYFSGIDLVDGTPVLDIKPYLPEIEGIPAERAGWTSEATTTQISVEFSPTAKQQLDEWQARLGSTHPEVRLEKLIRETIQLDPRPLVYKRNADGASHAVRLFDGDVHFRFFENPPLAEVFEIKEC
jgi:tRNA-Thr(GGU) m(6)t(6)A37 methyltransferase TsaA